MYAGNGLLYPILGLASCVAFIYFSLGDLSFHAQEPKMSFVERNGTKFFVDGRPFYVNGWNSYWLMDQAVEDHSRHRVGTMLQTGAKMGLTVCRTWAFNDGAYNALQVSLGRFDERVFRALDRVIAEAHKHGIRLLLGLANNLQAFGGKTQYVKWAWEEGIGLSSSNDSFFFDPSIRSYFKIYLKTLLTRKNHLTGIEYRDDPAIFGWELMNEPRCTSDPTGDTFQDWLEEMSGFVKSLDQKHLLTLGLEGFYGPTSPPEKLSVNPAEWASQIGSDFIRNSKIATIDFASVHIYPDQWFVGKDLDLGEKIKYVSRWVKSHIDDGDHELGKPVMFTEFGLSNKNKDFEHSQRETFYKGIFDIMYDSARKYGSGAGTFIWQLLVGGMEEYNDDFGIVPGERPSIYKLMKEQSCRLAAICYGKDWVRKSSKEIC
uniref:mannan endo-1,4-beta-mannosidase n=1 Tax=Anthurium amnicola TaxID=1678845 RepID=A0A1D1XMG2_9ARAE